eukprot:1685049-Rhodomonas_salina.1
MPPGFNPNQQNFHQQPFALGRGDSQQMFSSSDTQFDRRESDSPFSQGPASGTAHLPPDGYLRNQDSPAYEAQQQQHMNYQSFSSQQSQQQLGQHEMVQQDDLLAGATDPFGQGSQYSTWSFDQS